MQPQTFAQVCLLCQAGNLNRCLPRAAMLMEMLCQDANKKKTNPFLSSSACKMSAAEQHKSENHCYYLTLLAEEGSAFPLPGPSQTHHCLPLSAHFPKCRGGMSRHHPCQQHTLPYLFPVMAQQLKAKQEFQHLLIRRVGHQMRIWELWVLPQIRPFNPVMAPLPTWEAEIKPLLLRARDLWKVHLLVLSQEYQT